MNDATCIPLYRLFCFFQHNSSGKMASRIFTPMFTLLVYLFVVAAPGVVFYFVGQMYDTFTYPDPGDHTPELWLDVGFWVVVPALLLFYAVRALFECLCVTCCMPSLSQ